LYFNVDVRCGGTLIILPPVSMILWP
jgi:hypothetical protein